MDSIDRDKYLTEKMGLCYHELQCEYSRPVCTKCGKNENDNPNFALENYKYNFSTWEGFGKLWEWATEQEGFMSLFEDHMYGRDKEHKPSVYILKSFFNPDKFADTIYKFLTTHDSLKEKV